jgi:hypothetical protein
MAMFVFMSPTLVRVGPGYLVQISGLAGPTALDDVLEVYVQEPTTGAAICIGQAFCGGFTTVQVILGVVVNDVHGPFAHWSQVDVGDSVELVANHSDSSMSLIETVTFTGLVWDPVNGVGSLVSNLHTSTGPGGSLGSILAAVRRSFT